MHNSPLKKAEKVNTQLHGSCLGVVLSGGLSSRMGKDKSTLVRNNINMLGYSKQLLTDAGIDQIVISTKHQEPLSSELSVNESSADNLVTDIFKNAGPLGGIYSIIKQYQPAALLVLPIDLPLMNSTSLTKLKQIGELSQKACYYTNNYLPLYLPINAFVEQFLDNSFSSNFNSSDKKQRSIRALLKQIPSQEVTIDNPKVLFNSNTPEQWQYLKTNAFKLTSSQFDSINHNTLSPRKTYV